MKITVTGYNADDSIEYPDIELPAKFIICPDCNGKGSHVDRAIDGHGISSDEFDQDPDFAEAYFRGDYDVRCEEGCDNGKLLVPDEDRCKRKISTWKGLIRYENAISIKRKHESEDAYWRRMEEGLLG